MFLSYCKASPEQFCVTYEKRCVKNQMGISSLKNEAWKKWAEGTPTWHLVKIWLRGT